MKTYTKPESLLLELSFADILTMSVTAKGDQNNIDSYSFNDIIFSN